MPPHATGRLATGPASPAEATFAARSPFLSVGWDACVHVALVCAVRPAAESLSVVHVEASPFGLPTCRVAVDARARLRGAWRLHCDVRVPWGGAPRARATHETVGYGSHYFCENDFASRALPTCPDVLVSLHYLMHMLHDLDASRAALWPVRARTAHSGPRTARRRNSDSVTLGLALARSQGRGTLLSVHNIYSLGRRCHYSVLCCARVQPAADMLMYSKPDKSPPR